VTRPRPVLTVLEEKTGRKFGGDIWTFVKPAEKLEWDIKTPPKRPEMAFGEATKNESARPFLQRSR